MRKFLMVLLSGSLLSGCFDSDGTYITDSGDIGNDGDTSSPVPGNSAPNITGNPPASILVDTSYAFEPNASDPDGDTLTFEISNAPNWASFDSTTGKLSGQPTLANVGTYPGIVISVTDGMSSDSLAGFTIAVTQSEDGTITLSWVAPTENSDGSALVDLAGYTIHYGRESGRYERQIQIDNPSVTTYVVDQLSPDTYYFATTAYNASGAESSYSGEAVGVVN